MCSSMPRHGLIGFRAWSDDADIPSMDLAVNEATISYAECVSESESETSSDLEPPPIAAPCREPQTDNGTQPPPDPLRFALGLYTDLFRVSREQWRALAEILQSAESLESIRTLPISLTTIKSYHKHLPLATIHGLTKIFAFCFS